jgi:hypothetical protein
MTTNGLIGRLSRVLPVAASLMAFSTLIANTCVAQPPRFLTPPVPLGSPYVITGPVANPYGTPPISIGPAPPIFPNYPQFVPAAPYPPQVLYPITPLTVRRPTSFQNGVAAAGPQIPAVSQRIYGTVHAAPIVDQAAPIGNLRLTVSESFLNRLVARDETKPGEIRDFILGAQVSGRQTTATQVRLDLLPSAANARGALVLNGTTQSATTGVTPQAMVDVASQQQFVAIKEIFFDGMQFSTRHAVVHVRAKNQTLGAFTPLTGTLFGGIANRIAYREAERRKPEAEAVARDRVAERVFPEFDNTIDQQLASANDQLESKVRRLLRTANLMPTLQQVSTTETTLSYSMQVATETPTTTSAVFEGKRNVDRGLNLMVHESLLNALVARSGLKGMKTTDREIKALVAPFEYKIGKDELEAAQPPVGLPGMDNVVTDIEFDESDPLTIRLEQGRATVTMRAKFKPAGQDVLPALAVTIPYTNELIGDKFVVTPGKVQVAALDKDDESSIPPLAMSLLSNAIEASLSKLATDRTLPASVWPISGPLPRIVEVQTQDGWGAVTVE